MRTANELSGGRAVAKPSRKREHILDVATGLFSAHGIRGVGIDLITESAEVAGQTMYRHFDGKMDLAKAVLARRHDRVITDIKACVASVEGVDASIRAIFDWHEAWFKSEAFAGCLFERAIAEFGVEDPDVSDVAVHHKKTLIALLKDILRTEFAPKEALQLAEVMVMLLDGATANARAFGDPSSARKAWRAASALIAQARYASDV